MDDHATGNNLPFPIIPSNTNPPPSKKINIGTDIRRVIILVALILALSGIIIVIAWLVALPHKPDFAVNSLSLSKFNVSETQLKGDSNILIITIINTNKKAYLVIDTLYAYVCYHDTQLSTATAHSPIKLQSMSMIKMQAELGVGDFSYSRVVGKLNPSLPNLSTVGNGDFIVKMLVEARFKYLYQMLTWRMNLGIRCRITDMRFFIDRDMWDVSGLGFCDVYSEH